MGEIGIKREAATPDPLALLAVYSPGGERTARVVLHPRLTFVPCGPGDLSAIRETFRIDTDIRILIASDLELVGQMLLATERADVYADAITSVEHACNRRDTAAQRVEVAEQQLHEARAAFDRIGAQRADADAAIAVASEQLVALERDSETELQLRHDLHAACDAEANAAAEERAARTALYGGDDADDADEDVLAALREAERARDVRVALTDYCSRLDDAPDPEAVALASRWERAVARSDPSDLPTPGAAEIEDEVAVATRALALAEEGLLRVRAAIAAKTHEATDVDDAADRLRQWSAERAVERVREDLLRWTSKHAAVAASPPDAFGAAGERREIHAAATRLLGFDAGDDVAGALLAFRRVPQESRRQLEDALRRAHVDGVGEPADAVAHRWLAAQTEAALGAELLRDPDRHLRERVARAEIALTAAQDGVAAFDRELAARAQRRDATPVADATALRTQIAAVRSSIGAAEAERVRAVAAAEQELDDGRRDVAGADRELVLAVERADPRADGRDPDRVLAELRQRHDELAQEGAADVAGPMGAMRRIVADSAEPMLVMIEAFDPPPPDLVDILVAVSERKRLVYLTDNADVLDRARGVAVELGATREPLETGGVPRHAMARPDGDPT